MEKQTWHVYGIYGEIDYFVEKDLAETIQGAWNYEAQVYDSESNLVFDGWLDDDEQNELLEPYGLMVVELGDYRYLKNIKTGKLYLDDWQKRPESQLTITDNTKERSNGK